jgi:uncharacterized membrane protein YhaH (DUF805 family)
MLAAMFSFRGRINRLQYFLGSVASVAAAALLSTLFIGFVDLPANTPPTFALGVDAVMLVLAAPLVVWIWVSIQARRMRDIGWPPFAAVPAWVAAVVGSEMLGGTAGQSHLAIGAAISFMVLSCLFAWPGRRDRVDHGLSLGRRTRWAPSSGFSTSSRRLAPARLGRR